MFKFKTFFITAILALSLGTAHAADKFITVASTTSTANSAASRQSNTTVLRRPALHRPPAHCWPRCRRRGRDVTVPRRWRALHRRRCYGGRPP